MAKIKLPRFVLEDFWEIGSPKVQKNIDVPVITNTGNFATHGISQTASLPPRSFIGPESVDGPGGMVRLSPFDPSLF